jgi:hypothetical protein
VDRAENWNFENTRQWRDRTSESALHSIQELLGHNKILICQQEKALRIGFGSKNLTSAKTVVETHIEDHFGPMIVRGIVIRPMDVHLENAHELTIYRIVGLRSGSIMLGLPDLNMLPPTTGTYILV